MSVLSAGFRKQLESGVLAARRAAELGARSAIENLGVFSDRKPDHVAGDAAVLRNGLRAKWRQLGLEKDLLVAECAFEQWHRLLFARFLAENELLLHPDLNIPVTLDECGELAEDLGEPDGWSVAARFASQILPGIFRLEDPCVRIRLAPEHRIALEEILASLPVEMFTADDSLGWVYQYWQKDSKDEVNASERKVGGADLGPVTQLFTENYMVRFLLENSLGAWWAARHPQSPLLKLWEYLRFNEDGTPAAGSFDGWPTRVAEVTVIDPCCGSGHFLVDAFGMLWRMRAEEEGLSPVDAQDAVLRDNLFGLELDPRCVQIAMFGVALQAWKDGGGWRQLPTPNIACSGVPVKTPLKEWTQLAKGDGRLESALTKLHVLFREADTLGSLIDPRRAVAGRDEQSFDDVEWGEVLPLVTRAMSSETTDPSTAVLTASAASIARAGQYLGRRYTLAATNVPYLTSQKSSDGLRRFLEASFPVGAMDLFAAMFLRLADLAAAVAVVSPQKWWFLDSFEGFRAHVLPQGLVAFAANLGSKSFSTPMWDFPIGLTLGTGSPPGSISFISAETGRNAPEKDDLLRSGPLSSRALSSVRESPGAVISSVQMGAGAPLAQVCDLFEGMKPGQTQRSTREFWEVAVAPGSWELLASSPSGSETEYRGLTKVILSNELLGRYVPEANTSGSAAHGRRGVVIAKIGDLPASLYGGWRFDNNTFAIVPKSPELDAALWCFVKSGEFVRAARSLNQKLDIALGAVGRVPFDVERWRRIAGEQFPDGLPEPWSDDPTQWLFEGRPEVSTSPLQVAVGRLLGFRWPEQPELDDLDRFADSDGIVCLPSVAGEAPAADQLADLLAAAYGASWNAGTLNKLLSDAGSKKRALADWLRDEFFKQHCALFGNRPFVWHVWDGHPQGFSVLVNYHRLDRKTLEKLAYTYLGTDWIERQRAAVRDDEPGAEARLAAAEGLKKKLELILQGEPPYDIYVRWKPLEEQPLGWDPDLDDGVRVNIRPFVEAGVLRSTFNIHWKKDRGTNPDGTERLNDIHLTLAEKQNARKKSR